MMPVQESVSLDIAAAEILHNSPICFPQMLIFLLSTITKPLNMWSVSMSLYMAKQATAELLCSFQKLGAQS